MPVPLHPRHRHQRPGARALPGKPRAMLRASLWALALVALPTVHAATVTVTTSTDEDDGVTTSIAALGTGGPDGRISLREAILAANNTAGANTITLSSLTYTLTSSFGGTPTISNALTIQGNGVSRTSISGGSSIRIFVISGATNVSFSQLTLKSGAAASGDGGAILNGTGTLTLSSVTLSGNKANSGNGGAVSNPGGTLSLTSTSFSSNSCSGSGGAIYSTGTVTDSASTLSSNTATTGNGGAIALSGAGSATLTGTTLNSNRATAGMGGAIYASAGNLSLASISASNNSAGSDGGAIDLVSGVFTDTNGSYSSNSTSNGGNGGALALSGISSMTLTGTGISNGQSGGNGGAIAFAGSSTLTLSTVNLSNNSAGQRGGDNGSASGYGGAIYNSAGNLTLTGVTASGNQSGLDGGAIESLYGTLTDTNGGYSSNTSSNGDGGAVNLDVSGSASFAGTSVSGNSAQGAGGGIAVAGTGNLGTSAGASIRSNSASSGGGISFQGSGVLTIADSTFASNTAGSGNNGTGYGGGGLFMNAGSGAIDRSTFTANTSTSGGGDNGGCGNSSNGCGGGAINYQSASTLTLTNDTIENNVSSKGAGVLVDGGTVTLMNVTVATNQGTTGAGLLRQAGTLRLTNTIVAYSYSGSNCSGTITSGGNNLDSGTTCGFGTGNLVNVDPYLAPLASNGGLTQTRALYSDSPAINAGTPTGAPSIDQRSVTRDALPDIGAYEFNGGTGSHTPYPSKFNAVDGYFGAYPSSSSGQRIYTKLVGTSFTLNLAALNSATPTPGLLSPGYVSGTNRVRVDLVDDTDGSCASSCSGSNCTGKSAVASAITSFASGDGSYRTAIPLTVSGAYAKLRARILDTSYAPVYACSVDVFSVRPASLTISSSANADANGISASATPTIKAGATFTLSASVTGNNNGGNYSGIPAINLAAITTNPSHAGTLSGSFGSGHGGDGGGVNGNFTYSEAGYFSLNAYAVTDQSFTAVDQVGDCTADYSNTLVNGQYGCYFGNAGATNYFGRFIPDHFSITAGTATPACGSFTYFDQDGLVTLFTLTAKNSGNVTTQNYTGAFARLALTNWAGFGFTGDTATPSASATAPSGNWSNGVASVTAKHQMVVRPTAAPLAPVTLIVSAQPVDPDGVTSSAATAVMSPGTPLKFGELALASASGPATVNLSLTVNANIWNGAGWVTNTADSCTGAALGNASIAVGNQVRASGASGTFSTSVVATPSLASSWSQGSGTIVLAAPNVAGTAQVALNLGAASTDASCIGWTVTSTGAGVPWLRGLWCGNTYSKDPSSLATFGTATTTAPFVYLRENH